MEIPDNVFQFKAKGESIEAKAAPNPDDGEKVLHEIMSTETRGADGDLLEETVSLGVPGEDEEPENKEWLKRKVA
jgi:hypothetical protein